MKIKKMLSQYRRDFTALYECEHCGHEHENSGYDDGYFHSEVIPAMKCPACGRTASADYLPRPTKYAEGEVV